MKKLLIIIFLLVFTICNVSFAKELNFKDYNFQWEDNLVKEVYDKIELYNIKRECFIYELMLKFNFTYEEASQIINEK